VALITPITNGLSNNSSFPLQFNVNIKGSYLFLMVKDKADVGSSMVMSNECNNQ
jgi:hypothetical protein